MWIQRIYDKKYSKLRGFASTFTDRLLRPLFKIIEIKIVCKLLSIINRLYYVSSLFQIIIDSVPSKIYDKKLIQKLRNL